MPYDAARWVHNAILVLLWTVDAVDRAGVDDRRLDKTALAQASESQLAGVLQAHIAGRAAVVAEARGQLEGKHELVYKMDKLMPTFYAEMDIQPGSIHDQIIRDKIHDDAIAKLVGGLLFAIVAIALTVVSAGAATPAVVAAGARSARRVSARTWRTTSTSSTPRSTRSPTQGSPTTPP